MPWLYIAGLYEPCRHSAGRITAGTLCVIGDKICFYFLQNSWKNYRKVFLYSKGDFYGYKLPGF
jgi:hypothetical protein